MWEREARKAVQSIPAPAIRARVITATSPYIFVVRCGVEFVLSMGLQYRVTLGELGARGAPLLITKGVLCRIRNIVICNM